MPDYTLLEGDCLESLKTLADNSIDAVCTDPPYELGFMGNGWDATGIANNPALWSEVLRALKPGGHLASFSSTRTYHRMACAIEDGGFEVRDQLAWVYGQGFPKSLDVSKAIDKANGREFEDRYELGRHIKECRENKGISRSELNDAFYSVSICNHWEAQDRNNASVPTPDHWERLKQRLGCDARFDALVDRVGAEREVAGVSPHSANRGQASGSTTFIGQSEPERLITAPATDAARQWEGWGTALKPAWEPICLARKPLSEKTVAANALRWGTGAINVDGCRIEGLGSADPNWRRPGIKETGKPMSGLAGISDDRAHFVASDNSKGRFPANLCHDGSQEVLDLFPESKSTGGLKPIDTGASIGAFEEKAHRPFFNHGDSGSAARFFYCAKASKGDRAGSRHPTVKPVKLMQWLSRLICPSGGVILDPFAGSGTTGLAARLEGFRSILCEREPEYIADIRNRMDETPISNPQDVRAPEKAQISRALSLCL